MSGFSTKNKKKKDSSSVEALRTELKEQFEQAAYGQFFRTCTFNYAAHELDQEWLEAFYSPKLGWSIKQVIKADDIETGVPALTTSLKNHGLTFFEAVEKLAQYEHSQEMMSAFRAEDGEKEKLGHQHYQAFGEREGLAFDTAGQPHASMEDGHVIDEATFPVDAFDKVKEAQKNKKVRLNLPVPDMLVQDISASEFENAKDTIEALDLIIKNMNRVYKDQLEHYKAKGQGKFYHFALRDPKSYSPKSNHQDLFDSAVLLLHQTDQLLHDIGDMAQGRLVGTSVYIFKYHTLVLSAAHDEEYSEDFLTAAETTLKDMGFQDGTGAKVYRDYRRSCHCITQENIEKATAQMKEVVSFLENLRNYTERQLKIDTGSDVKQLPTQKSLWKALRP